MALKIVTLCVLRTGKSPGLLGAKYRTGLFIDANCDATGNKYARYIFQLRLWVAGYVKLLLVIIIELFPFLSAKFTQLQT
jgi:hypothetical protein